MNKSQHGRIEWIKAGLDPKWHILVERDGDLLHFACGGSVRESEIISRRNLFPASRTCIECNYYEICDWE